jgi:hypothetical protein
MVGNWEVDFWFARYPAGSLDAYKDLKRRFKARTGSPIMYHGPQLLDVVARDGEPSSG